ncbi:MAG: thiamine pyrophosphate-binding protein [Elusimicrobia bacterium]|nr:thiamine pyrophosphate-binding protein [Elusimicrobiota bacterium]
MKPAVHFLLEYLEQEGVDYIFGIPGGPIMPLYEALYARGRIKPILAKHEEGAAFMADGYARASGRIGVCCTTTGPGATNALTGLAVAYADQIPVLLLTAQVPTHQFGMGAFQESGPETIDLVGLFKPVTKWSAMIPHPARTAASIRAALRLMQSGRPGPVHLNIPLDYISRPLEDEAPVPAPRYRFPGATFDRRAVREAAARLLTARRPVILAGHGVNVSRAWEPLRALAERLRMPVATSFKAKGALPEDHPLSLGVFGHSGSAATREFVLSPETDLLFVVGSALGEVSSCGFDRGLARKKSFLQLDVDAGVIGRNFPVDVGLCGDAAATLVELRYEAERRLKSGWAAAAPFLPPPRVEDPLLPDAPGAGLSPRALLAELRAALPRDAAVFVDNGSIRAWAGVHFPVYRENAFFVNMGMASMGYAVAASIGGKLARPNTPVVALVGDAAFAMNGMEVHAAVEHKVPVIWVVVNNGGHGMIYHGERAQFGGKFRSSVFSRELDVAGIARGLGARAVRVERPGELAQAVRRALDADGPVVIDVLSNLADAPPMGARVRALQQELAAA